MTTMQFYLLRRGIMHHRNLRMVEIGRDFILLSAQSLLNQGHPDQVAQGHTLEICKKGGSLWDNLWAICASAFSLGKK